jgi:hypothetical protein
VDADDKDVEDEVEEAEGEVRVGGG